MSVIPEGAPPVDIDSLLVAMRPKLHRYCARMTGSVIDGEDVLQDALVKAVEAFASAAPIQKPDGWLFRIAHNAALDFLRRRTGAAKCLTIDSDKLRYRSIGKRALASPHRMTT